MNKKEAARRGGMGFIGTLTLILVVLRLFNLIDWSWFWVLSPVWGVALLVLVIFSFIVVGGKIKKGNR